MPDMLFLLAAGNFGSDGLHSIATPAVAKNVLTVGASRNSLCSFVERGERSGVEVVDGPKNTKGKFGVALATFGGSFVAFKPPTSADPDPTLLRACVASPPTACTPLTNADACRGKVVFVTRFPQVSSCTFVAKALHVQRAGGAMMVMLNDPPPGSEAANEDNSYFVMGADDGDDPRGSGGVHIPLVAAEQSLVAKLRPLLANEALIASLRLRALPVMLGSSTSSSESILSAFSSMGPTSDGRIKPDLVVPGEWIESARSDHDLGSFQCAQAMVRPSVGASGTARSFKKEAALRADEGTSMATPIATGTAALVRQYFTEGHYPGAGPTISSPSSALLKAVMISGTVPLAGEVLYRPGKPRIPIAPPPSAHQGFGRLQLDRVLSYDLGEGKQRKRSALDLFVKDQVWISTGEVHQYCFRARNSSSAVAAAAEEFKATLVWTDPLSALTGVFFLVNDLDLMVVEMPAPATAGAAAEEGGGHRVWVGNAVADSEEHAASAAGKPGAGISPQLQFDTLNNVEKVSLPHGPSGTLYSVMVRGTHVPVTGPGARASETNPDGSRGQKYALVVNGAFEPEAECPRQVYCPADCSGHGECIVVPADEGDASHANPPSIGLCRCDKYWAGARCDIPMLPLLSANTSSFSSDAPVVTASTALTREQLRPDSWTFLYVDVGPRDWKVVFNVSRVAPAGGLSVGGTDEGGDPDFYFLAPNSTAAMERAAATAVARGDRQAAAIMRSRTYPSQSFFTPTYSTSSSGTARVPTSPVVLCDNCPRDAKTIAAGEPVHSVEFGEENLFAADDVPDANTGARKGGGVLVLGVWENCCDSATASVSVEVHRRIPATE